MAKFYVYNGSRYVLAGEGQTDSDLSSTSTNPIQNKAVYAALSNKVDKVSGKGLSTNDYTTAEKEQVAANTTARHTLHLPTITSSHSIQNYIQKCST